MHQAQRGDPRIEPLVRRVRAIPASLRRYDCGASDALSHFGLDADALDALVDAGLPHSDAPERRYEFADLHYLGLALGTAGIYAATVRRWATALVQLSASGSTRLEIAVIPRFDRAASSEVDGTVHLPEGDRHVILKDGRVAAKIRVSAHGRWPTIPPPAAHAVASVARELDFCMLPAAAQGDVALARRTGLADCWTAARLLIEECRAIGVEARMGHGLLLSIPFSTVHSWAELRVDGGWVPVDPVMVKLMRSIGGLDADAWPWSRSIGALCLRICDERRPLVESPSGEVSATFLTQLDEARLAPAPSPG